MWQVAKGSAGDNLHLPGPPVLAMLHGKLHRVPPSPPTIVRLHGAPPTTCIPSHTGAPPASPFHNAGGACGGGSVDLIGRKRPVVLHRGACASNACGLVYM